MRDLVKKFPQQLEHALEIAEQSVIKGSDPCSSVIITGLGGSGIGGTILSELVGEKSKVPVLVNKDYSLPGWINAQTLVLVSSYSGNTEETVTAMEQALEAGAQVVCITSGGKVMEMAKAHGLDCIVIPGGMPPRSCLGYSLVQLIRVMVFRQLIPSSYLEEIKLAAQFLLSEAEPIQSLSKAIAARLVDKIPVLYAIGNCEGVIVRFRQQINENSKMLCWHHIFPEMNHNELVGWTEPHPDKVVVSFQTTFTNKRTQKRYEICRPVFSKYAADIVDVVAKGRNLTEQFLYLVHLGDWISVDIADLRGIDAVEVNVINHLKNELARFE